MNEMKWKKKKKKKKTVYKIYYSKIAHKSQIQKWHWDVIKFLTERKVKIFFKLLYGENNKIQYEDSR